MDSLWRHPGPTEEIDPQEKLITFLQQDSSPPGRYIWVGAPNSPRDNEEEK